VLRVGFGNGDGDPAGSRDVVNLLVAGVPPDRLRCRRALGARQQRIGGDRTTTTVVVAVGQFLRGHDVVPRGHPGDGRAELQIYRVRPREWPALRRRLATGTHLPHPAIETRSVRHYEITSDRPFPVELDGQAAGRATHLRVEVVPAAYTLLL
jgi:diacylglycerol kinase family enzyme